MIWSNLLSFASLSERLSAPWAFDLGHVAVSLISTLLSWDSLTSAPPPFIQLRPLPLHIAVGLRRVAATRLACSARVLSQHLDGLLRSWLASLLHLAAGRGSPLLRPSTHIRRCLFQDTVAALTQRIHSHRWVYIAAYKSATFARLSQRNPAPRCLETRMR